MTEYVLISNDDQPEDGFIFRRIMQLEDSECLVAIFENPGVRQDYVDVPLEIADKVTGCERPYDAPIAGQWYFVVEE